MRKRAPQFSIVVHPFADAALLVEAFYQFERTLQECLVPARPSKFSGESQKASPTLGVALAILRSSHDYTNAIFLQFIRQRSEDTAYFLASDDDHVSRPSMLGAGEPSEIYIQKPYKTIFRIAISKTTKNVLTQDIAGFEGNGKKVPIQACVAKQCSQWAISMSVLELH
jgi:hypothetical protein